MSNFHSFVLFSIIYFSLGVAVFHFYIICVTIVYFVIIHVSFSTRRLFNIWRHEAYVLISFYLL